MRWPFSRSQRSDDDLDESVRESQARLNDARELTSRAEAVFSSMRETRERNSFAESFRSAMGGAPG